MPRTKNESSASFADIVPIMHKAASEAEGLRFRLATYGQAVNFRQRCYRWRVKQQELAAARLGEVPGIEATTPYDDLVLTIEDGVGRTLTQKDETAPPPFDVVIRHREACGELLSLDGKPLRLEPAPRPGHEIDVDLDFLDEEDEG